MTRGASEQPVPQGQGRVGAPAAGQPQGNGAQAAGSVALPTALTVRQLADALGRNPVEVIKQLMRQGVMAAINQVIDYETAAAVAASWGVHVSRLEAPSPGASAAARPAAPDEADMAKAVVRPPVVTILGHVDHGKTTLLDAIRESEVAAREVGGITQHIGAYQVEYKGQRVTFLDTPGHEAFTAMRARGARVTDIAILVVAADDGVMPQTVEAIDHARAAKLSIVVAINKIDKPGADPEKVTRQLADLGLIPEKWGGDTIIVPISAKKRQGIDDLLENILVVAEVSELKANPDRPAQGVVIEARLDQSRGPVATVLVQNGTLHVGDNVVVGESWGRIKAMFNEVAKRVRQAGPATPVEVLGLATLPQAGDTLAVVPDEKTAKAMLEERRRQREALQGTRPSAMEEVLAKLRTGEVRELPIILKCDVQGSVEAVKTALARVSSEKAQLNIIHAGAGTITESDISLAVASRALVVGFTTRVESGARRLAEQEGIEVRLYDIIYKLTEDLQKALEGLLEPEEREVIDGHAQVKAIFSLSKRGKVAGCIVTDGRLARSGSVRVLRGGKVVHDGPVSSLRRFTEDVREVTSGFECGIGLEGFSDFQVGDVLEAHHVERG